MAISIGLIDGGKNKLERHGPFKLVSIMWILIEHTETYDELGFVIKLEPKAHVIT